MRVAAVLVAAGRGERFGHELPKAFVSLAGRSLVLRAAEALFAAPEVTCIVPVVPGDGLERFRALVAEFGESPCLAAPVAGGAERQDSVAAGLEALPADFDLVAVHDAARPLVRPEAVSRVVAAAARAGAAILATPVGDTLKRVADGRIVETPERSAFWAAQTPQVFRVELLREALAKAQAAGLRATDDAALVERLGAAVHVVEGDSDNLKLTHAEDLAVAERILARREETGA